MTSIDCAPRLAVVAAIINGGPTTRSSLAQAARLGGDLRASSGTAVTVDATPQERALAQALKQEPGEAISGHAIADLLLLADYEQAADDLAARLSQVYLEAEAGQPQTTGAARKHRPTFADLYRKLSLHLLSSQVRNKAAATLCQLTSH